MSIFDFIKAQEIGAYWENDYTDTDTYWSESKFPNTKVNGRTISWFKAKGGRVVQLKLSALDTKAVPRGREGLQHAIAELPFFKESRVVDETLHMDLLDALNSGNDALKNNILIKMFDDASDLIKSARVTREVMRMQLLTTGQITLASNGQSYEYDYGLDEEQKVSVDTSWSDPNADIIGDIRGWQDSVEERTGVRPTEAVCNRNTFNYILNNTAIKNTIFANYATANGQLQLTDDIAKAYILNSLGVSLEINSKRYGVEGGGTMPYVPDDTFVLIPEGKLGNTNFGITPEEARLIGSNAAEEVYIVDTGVAVTTAKTHDPVTVEVKVTQLCLPDFPMADQIIIADVVA